MGTTPASYGSDALTLQLAEHRGRRWWWVPLITGILWLVFAVVVFRFDLTSVSAVGTLIGIVFIVAGVEEFLAVSVVRGGWAWFHGILGFALIIGGIVAMAYPDRTFVTLASIVGILLLLKGVFDVVLALASRGTDLWWMRLVIGAVELALAVAVSGSLVRKAIFVLVFVGATALTRGVLQIVLAFQLRALGREST